MTDTPTPPSWATVPRTTVRWSLARVDGDTTDVAVGDRVTLHPTVTGIAVVDPLDTNPVSVILEPRTFKLRGDGALVDDEGDMAAVLAVDDPRVATPGGRVVQWVARHERRHGAIRFPAAAGETVELSRWVAATAPEPTQRSWAEQLVDAAEDVTAGLAAAVGAGDAAVAAAGYAAGSATSAADSAATATEQAGLATTARDEARTAADAAGVSAGAAGAAAVAAAGSESAAAGHATSAAGSADSAASSASAAASYAGAASSSATTAGDHATDAGDALTATVEARDLTLGYRDTAAGHATTAAEQAGLAATARTGAEAAHAAASALGYTGVGTHPALNTVFDRCWRPALTNAFDVPTDSGHYLTPLNPTAMVTAQYLENLGPLKVGISPFLAGDLPPNGFIVSGFTSIVPSVEVQFRSVATAHRHRLLLLRWTDAQNYIAIQIRTRALFAAIVADGELVMETPLISGAAGGWPQTSMILEGAIHLTAQVRAVHTNYASSGYAIAVLWAGQYAGAPIPTEKWVEQAGRVGWTTSAEDHIYGFRAGNVRG